MNVNKEVKRYAFSLIELLIVIVIIGVVYTLVVGNLQGINDEEEEISLKNLKEYLLKFEHEKSVTLLCLDDCLRCDILVDNNKTTTIEGFLDESVQSYTYDTSYGYIETEKEVYFNTEGVEEDVCFFYEIDKSGVGLQVLVEYKEKYYDYTTYFDDTKVYYSLEDAREAKENLIKEVRE